MNQSPVLSKIFLKSSFLPDKPKLGEKLTNFLEPEFAKIEIVEGWMSEFNDLAMAFQFFCQCKKSGMLAVMRILKAVKYDLLHRKS